MPARRFTGALCACALGLLHSHALAAQSLHGIVVDSLSRRPVAGATVTALAGGDSVLARIRTESDGRFTIGVDSTSPPRRLRVIALGFAPRTLSIGDRELAADLGAGIEVALSGLPSRLDTVRVDALAGCRRTDNAASAVSRWLDLREELLAAEHRVSERAPNAVVTNARWYYDYLVDTLHAVTQLAAFESARASLDAFLRGEPRDTAAGADLLFGAEFLGRHCVRLVKGSGVHAGETAVEFEPVRGSAVALSTAGHWWASAAGGRFRELEFSYAGSRLPGVHAAHGWIEYAVDDSGAVGATADWWMYLEPTKAEASSWRAGHRPSGGGSRERWNEWTARTESISSPPVVRGAVRTRRGQPRGGIRVQLLDLGQADGPPAFRMGPVIATTTTDSAGEFRFTDLGDDWYLARAERATASGDSLFSLFTHVDWLELESYEGSPFRRLELPRDARSWGARIFAYPPDRERRLVIELRAR